MGGVNRDVDGVKLFGDLLQRKLRKVIGIHCCLLLIGRDGPN